eukprot:3706358-Amphidinium_carterae.1
MEEDSCGQSASLRFLGIAIPGSRDEAMARLCLDGDSQCASGRTLRTYLHSQAQTAVDAEDGTPSDLY